MTFLLYPFSSLNERFYRYHNIKENIDFLVLGNSLENCGIVPSVLDKNLGQHCGVLAPQGSYPESLYYLLVDVAHTHKVKTLLAGWDVMQNFQLPAYKYPHAEELYREFFADMKGNAELQKIVFKNIMEQRYTSTFFDWSSFPENVREIPRVIESRKKPVDLENKITTIPMDISKLKDDRKKDKYNYYQATERIYGTEIQENDKKYFLKIQKYCKDNNIILMDYDQIIPELEKSEDQLLTFYDQQNTNHRIYQTIYKIEKGGTIELPYDFIEKLKGVKNPVEIEGFKSANLKDSVALIKFFSWMEDELVTKNRTDLNEYQIGLKNKEVRLEQEDYMGESFAPICGCGGNAAIIHYEQNETLKL